MLGARRPRRRGRADPALRPPALAVLSAAMRADPCRAALGRGWRHRRGAAAARAGRRGRRRDAGPACASRAASRCAPWRSGVSGRADVVEFRGRPPRPFPVEYKRGKPKAHRADEVQLCAQAICLEEMFGVAPCREGALFYGETRRRMAVAFDAALRALTAAVAAEPRAALIAAGARRRRCRTPACRRCSLPNLCRPERLERPPRGRRAGSPAQLDGLRATDAPAAQHHLRHQRGRLAAQGRREPRRRGGGRRARPGAAAHARGCGQFRPRRRLAGAHGGLCRGRDRAVPSGAERAFLARVEGPRTGNVLLRRTQYRVADDPARQVPIVRGIVAAKAANQRAVLRRALRDHGDAMDPAARDMLLHSSAS